MQCSEASAGHLSYMFALLYCNEFQVNETAIYESVQLNSWAQAETHHI